MKIGFIGAGKVGSAFGHYLLDRGLEVLGYSSRSIDSAVTAAEFTKTSYYELKDLVDKCEYIFITTPDDVISEVWKKLKSFNLQDKKIFHMCGSLSSLVFDDIESFGAYGYSLHPLFPFKNKTQYKGLGTAVFTIEGKKIAEIKGFLSVSGIKYFEISSDNRNKYHAAAVFASNYLVCLGKISKELFLECGIPHEEVLTALYPLMSTALNNVRDNGIELALTGPILRGDTGTVKKQSDALGVYKNIYDELGRIAVGIALENGNLTKQKADEMMEILGGRNNEKNS